MKKQLITFFSLCICLLASAQPFRFIVAQDGSGSHTTIQAAINACPDNERSLVFIKNGLYDEQVTLGSKAVASLKKISLIGESTNGVIITHHQSRASSGSPTFEDICTVKLYANDFYAENLTIQNTAGNTGMAEALYTAGDRQTFQNCRILGYQDTYRSKKGTRGYFKNCWIEGAVDFIYAGGVVFFDDCTINCVKGGGYITAPEDAIVTIPKAQTVSQKFLRVGFFFRNCDITANSDVPDNSYYLGRPWTTMAGSFYLNCKLGKHIKAEGWKEWNGNETTSSFAEYNSTDMNRVPIDTTKRVGWSFQLPKADVDNLLSPEAIYARVSSSILYDPITFCQRPQAPANLRIESGKLVWDAAQGAAGYLVYKNGAFLAQTTETSMVDNFGIGEIHAYTLYSIATSGVLSKANTPITAVENPMAESILVTIQNSSLYFSEDTRFALYNIRGEKIAFSDKYCQIFPILKYSKGIYLLQLEGRNFRTQTIKIRLD